MERSGRSCEKLALRSGGSCERLAPGSTTWSLPSGQTYRVTGRPHPDGAVAFLFEDISSEISLTRRFRAAAELSHEVFDSLDEAVAVFQPSGELLMSNTAFTRLWQFDPAETLGCVTLNDTIRVWQSFSLPNPVWTSLQGYASRMGDRRPLSAGIALRDGRHLSCRFLPLTGGGLKPEDAGKAADARLQAIHWPLDLVWLGMGADGHTASIFPGPDLEAALAAPYRAIGVTPDPLPKEAPVARVTLTRGAILSAKSVLISISGEVKKELLEDALADGASSKLPVGRVLADASQAIDIHWCP